MSIHFCLDASEFLRHLDRWLYDAANVAFRFASAISQSEAFDYNGTKNSPSLFLFCANDSVLFAFTLLVFAQEFILCAFASKKNTFAQ
jgi:hypothetical protein